VNHIIQTPIPHIASVFYTRVVNFANETKLLSRSFTLWLCDVVTHNEAEKELLYLQQSTLSPAQSKIQENNIAIRKCEVTLFLQTQNE
jgi:hypothetical protein